MWHLMNSFYQYRCSAELVKIRYEGNVGSVKLHFKMYTKLLFLTSRRNATYEQEYLAFSKLGVVKGLTLVITS